MSLYQAHFVYSEVNSEINLTFGKKNRNHKGTTNEQENVDALRKWQKEQYWNRNIIA